MDALLAAGLARRIVQLATAKDGPRVLIDLGTDTELGVHKVCLRDVDKHLGLLEALAASAHVKTRKAFKDGFMQLNKVHHLKLAGNLHCAAWAEYEAEKANLLWQYAYRFLKRPGFTRSVSITRLRTVFSPSRKELDLGEDSETTTADVGKATVSALDLQTVDANKLFRGL